MLSRLTCSAPQPTLKGELLNAVQAYERGDFPTLPAADEGVSLAGSYRAALEWVDEAGRVIA